MPAPDLNTIQERFECVAADILEGMIAEIEQKNHVKVTDLAVDLLADEAVPAGAPVVEVNLTVEAVKLASHATPAREKN